MAEEVDKLPQDKSEMGALSDALQKPIIAKDAEQIFRPLIWTSNLKVLLNQLRNEDEKQDVRAPVYQYLETEYPQIAQKFTQFESSRDFNLEGTLSPLGHKDEVPARRTP